MLVTSKQRADQAVWGLMLIGLGVLLLVGNWFPAILFVIGGALIARSVMEGRHWASSRLGVILVVLGLFLWLPFDWSIACPMLMIVFGVALLLSRGQRLRA